MKCSFLLQAGEPSLVAEAKKALNTHIESTWWKHFHVLHSLPRVWPDFTDEQLVLVIAWVEAVSKNPLLQLVHEWEPPF